MHMSQTLGFSVYTISMISTTTTVVHVLALQIDRRPCDRRGSEYATALGMLLVPLDAHLLDFCPNAVPCVSRPVLQLYRLGGIPRGRDAASIASYPTRASLAIHRNL